MIYTAKCPNCGKIIEVCQSDYLGYPVFDENSRIDTFSCPKCGTRLITEVNIKLKEVGKEC